MHWEAHEFGMPKVPRNRRWHLVVDTGQEETMDFVSAGQEPELEDQMTYTVKGRSIVVLMGKVHEALNRSMKDRGKNDKRSDDKGSSDEKV